MYHLVGRTAGIATTQPQPAAQRMAHELAVSEPLAAQWTMMLLLALVLTVLLLKHCCSTMASLHTQVRVSDQLAVFGPVVVVVPQQRLLVAPLVSSQLLLLLLPVVLP